MSSLNCTICACCTRWSSVCSSKSAWAKLTVKKYRTDGWVAFKKAGLVGVEYTLSLSSLSSDPSSQLDVLGHDRDSLGVDRAQVGVLEQADQIALAGFLQSHDGSALEPQVSLEVLGDFSDQSLEGQLSVNSSVDFWYLLISLRATVPGLYRWGFFTPPVEGALFLAALVASCFLGAFPPVLFRAVCFVRAILRKLSVAEL